MTLRRRLVALLPGRACPHCESWRRAAHAADLRALDADRHAADADTFTGRVLATRPDRALAAIGGALLARPEVRAVLGEARCAYWDGLYAAAAHEKGRAA